MSDPGVYNFTIYKGTTFTRVFTYRDAAGALVNLTGYTASFIAKPSANYGTNTISLTSGSGITLGGAAGTITVVIDAATTTALNDDALIYSLKLTTGGVVTALLKGAITVSGEVA